MSVPQQENGSDCGVYAVLFGYFVWSRLMSENIIDRAKFTESSFSSLSTLDQLCREELAMSSSSSSVSSSVYNSQFHLNGSAMEQLHNWLTPACVTQFRKEIYEHCMSIAATMPP